MDDSDAIWKALSDPTRRGILDELRAGPRTVGQLAERFPSVTRFAVMKHLNVLEEAKLVATLKEGRERRCFLNAATLRASYERWVDRFADAFAGSLAKLGTIAESPPAAASDRTIRLRFRVAEPLAKARERFGDRAITAALRDGGIDTNVRRVRDAARSTEFEFDRPPRGWSDGRLRLAFTSAGGGATWVDVEHDGWLEDGRPLAEASHALSAAMESIRRGA